MDDDNLARTASGQYTLGIFYVRNDNYITMSAALSEISEMERKLNNQIVIKGKVYKIIWDLGGDMVWHKTERGLNSCTSNYPCFACVIKRDKFHLLNSNIINKNLRNLVMSIISQCKGKKIHKINIK